MSGSLLDEKENAKSANEFAKEDKAFTTSSILKPSQKENVLQLGQLTPQKAPKVTFKNTPVRHHPARYKAELLHHPLDTWEEIRSLDEVENWTERTQVVTREDHQLHIESTKEFLNNLIDNLPCFKYISAKKEPGFSEISYKEKRENSSFENPVSLATTPIVNKPKTMDDGLDVDFAGPLDPAIASLNSLLKAGEDEERAFSPIGSGKASPDCDNMVTSDDIEKLLAPHNMPEEVDIPILELTHGSKIDAIMDSKFSGRHLDEVAAKLNELKLTSTKRNDTNADDSSDDDFALPVKPRGAPKKPPVIIEPKEDRKDSNEEKENGNDEDALPVRRRQPKAAPKKDVQSAPGEENETFKKPLPPKPWKTKKKKAPENDDPFLAMFAEPVKSIPSSNNVPKTTENLFASTVSTPAYPKPQTTITNAASQGKVASAKQGSEKNGSGNKDGVVLSDHQEDFGFGNDDFKSSGDAFSLELDYLEKFGNTNNLDRLSAFARQSLYVKFDPLCKGRSPDQDVRKMTADASASKQTHGNVDDLLMSTPPNRRAQTSKLASIKESDDKLKAHSDLSAVDRLLTFSPVAKGAPSSKPDDIQPAAPANTTPNQATDSSLVQPLLYSKSDIEVAVKKEREALLKQTHEESQVREMEIQEIFSKLQTEVENNSKLKRENDELRTVMKEYERTMAEMIETTEKNKNMSDESKNEIMKERDQLQADLNSVEAAFSDLHRRYEKIKGALENFKKNEEILKKAAHDYQEKLRKSGEKYQMLKKHAEEKIETANIEINRVRRSNDSEMAVMRAALKKEQNKSVSLEQAVQQKINENKELTAICDELIQRASGAQ